MNDYEKRKALAFMLEQIEGIGRRARTYRLMSRLGPIVLGDIMRTWRIENKFYECL